MANRGRPIKLTPAIADEFCAHIANGMSVHRTGQLLMIDKNTVSRWLKFGRQFRNTGKPAKHKIFAEFAEKVASSEARFIELNVKSVRLAAKPKRVTVRKTVSRPVFKKGVHVGDRVTTEETTKREHDWAAARWLLECKDRDSFGPDRHEIAALKKDMAELQKLLSKALERVGGKEGGTAGEVETPVVPPVEQPAIQPAEQPVIPEVGPPA